MKYMGSKRSMLTNGLGTLLKAEAVKHDRIVDLFCGAASVAWFSAQQTDRPVFACDLQSYSVVLAAAVIGRTKPANETKLSEEWIEQADAVRQQSSFWKPAQTLDAVPRNTGTWAKGARALCAVKAEKGIIWNSYGGYYFSPTQALTFDAMLLALPKTEPLRSLCLAAIIISASQCAASPGHTAQPFKATRTAAPFLREAWKRKPLDYARKALGMLGPQHAKVLGEARVGDAVSIAGTMKPTDLVFVDPPYSGVHYSRFYHVLETIARGGCGQVSGTGRYPPPDERPCSAFSRKTESEEALSLLLKNLSQCGSTVVLTFPAGVCSNGLSGTKVLNVSAKYFHIEKRKVKTRFSTMGGNNTHRDARQLSSEMILLLRPK